eukprot:scpid103144/ scgid6862/ 
MCSAGISIDCSIGNTYRVSRGINNQGNNTTHFTYTTTTTNPPLRTENGRPRRSTADYNRTRAFTVKIKPRQWERTTTAAAITSCGDGGDETRVEVSEEDRKGRTREDDGGSGDSSSAGEREVSDELCGSRERVHKFHGSKSSVYSHLVSSLDCCSTYSDS